MNTWTKLLCEAVNGTLDKVPKGFKTKREIMDAWELGDTSTERRIAALIGSGKIEKRIFRINQDGITRRIPHYRPKQ